MTIKVISESMAEAVADREKAVQVHAAIIASFMVAPEGTSQKETLSYYHSTSADISGSGNVLGR